MTPKAVEIVSTFITPASRIYGLPLVTALLGPQYIPKSANAHIKQNPSKTLENSESEIL
jgi:hypothetical protein